MEASTLRACGSVARQPRSFFHDETVRALFSRTVAAMREAYDSRRQAAHLRRLRTARPAPSSDVTYAGVAKELDLSDRHRSPTICTPRDAVSAMQALVTPSRARRHRRRNSGTRRASSSASTSLTTWLPDAVLDHLRVVATWPELPRRSLRASAARSAAAAWAPCTPPATRCSIATSRSRFERSRRRDWTRSAAA